MDREASCVVVGYVQVYEPVEADVVKQTLEIFRILNFTNSNTTRTFHLMIPNYASKVRVAVAWRNDTGNASDWDLFLTQPNGVLLANSTNTSSNANSTNLTMEEFILYEGPFNTTVEGLWNITVVRVSNESVAGFYNVSTQVHFSAGDWLSTNFSTNSNFNPAGQANSTHNVNATLTIPRFNILNGSYQGHITYHNNSGWKLKAPFTFELAAGHLLLNNSFGNTTILVLDNIGFNRLIYLNITYNNTGGFPVHFNASNSDQALFKTKTTTFANFTIDNPVPNPLTSGSGARFNITINASKNMTSDTDGLYLGWILFNSTNTTLNSSSYPYQLQNVTIQLNLSSALNVSISSISSGYSNIMFVERDNQTNNLTITATVRLLNETVISLTNILDLVHFTNASIQETNATSYIQTLINKTNATVGSSACGSGGSCTINFTIPANLMGGRYNLFLDVQWNTSLMQGTGALLSGTGANYSLVINGTGLNLSDVTSKSLGSINEASGTTFFNVTVKNYGPATAHSAQIAFNKGTCPVTVTAHDSGIFGSECSSISTGSDTFTLTINPFTANGCWLRFRLAADNVSGTTSCSNMNVTSSIHPVFSNVTGISLSVTETGGSSSGSGSGTGSGAGGISCSTSSDCPATQACSSGKCAALSCQSYEYIASHACVAYDLDIATNDTEFSAIPGESRSASVKVEEANNKTLTVQLNVTIDSSINSSISPSSCTTPCTFTVTLVPTNTSEVKSYTGSFDASSTIFPEVKESKPITFTVLPTEEKKAEISQEYSSLLPTIESLKMEFESLKATGALTAGNLTLAEGLINSINNLSASIKSSIDSGDFVTANTLLKELKQTIEQLQSSFSGLGTPKIQLDTFTWIIIGIVIAGAAGLVAYIFFISPRRGFKPSKPKPGLLQKKPSRFTTTTYVKGYQKQEGPGYKKKRENPLKKLFSRKKQKHLTDFNRAK